MSTHVHTEEYRPLKADHQAKSDPQPTADWSAYAATYDLLLEHNPAYQHLLEEFEIVLSETATPRVIYDVGGGTGNYSLIAAHRCPDSAIYFVEPDQGMRNRAKGKLSRHDNVVYIDRALQDVEAPTKADFVICAHALYAMPDHHKRLADLKTLLRPGGVLFLVDLGRPMNVSDWRYYLLSNLTKKLGVVKAIQILWKGREIAKQNKAIFKAQKDGLYWTHSEAEIRSAVETAGFEVLMQKSVYRGYSDLLVCRATS